MVLMMNLMRILVRLVLNWKFLEIISRFFATLSAVGCIFPFRCVTFLYVGHVNFSIKGPHHCFRAYHEGQTTTTHNNRLQQTATDCNRLQHVENFCVTPDNSTVSRLILWREWLQQTATDCNTLQHTATHCNTLQMCTYQKVCISRHTHCNTLQHTATRCNTLQRTATVYTFEIWIQLSYSLQHTATHCSTQQHTAIPCNTLQLCTYSRNLSVVILTATHCNTMQRIVTHCKTLQLRTRLRNFDRRLTHCITLQHIAKPSNTLQHTATHCNTLKHTATHCKCILFGEFSSVVLLTASHWNTLQHTAIMYLFENCH
jgi:hypothetical protein